MEGEGEGKREMWRRLEEEVLDSVRRRKGRYVGGVACMGERKQESVCV